MPSRRLADWIDDFERQGELVRITAEVELDGELAEITQRVAEQEGPAVLFSQVRRHRLPVLTNLLGTSRRLSQMLGVSSEDELAATLSERLDAGTQQSGGLYKLLVGDKADSFTPAAVRSGPSQQVVRLASDVDLSALPVPRFWPRDSHPLITAGQLFSRDPVSGIGNVGLYPLVRVDKTRLAVGWLSHQGAARHWQRSVEQGQRMPAAVAIGGDPLWTLVAMTPLPADMDESLLGGALAGRPFEMVRCRTEELLVPADAELVIEGYFDPVDSPVDVGPLAGPGGHYDHPRRWPVLNVTAITHRSNPVFTAIVPDPNASEFQVLASAAARILLPILRRRITGLVDFTLFPASQPFPLAAVAIEKTAAYQARRVVSALLSEPGFALTRLFVVVDASVDLRNASTVLASVARHAELPRDAWTHSGPAAPHESAALSGQPAEQLAIDATTKWQEELAPGHVGQLRQSKEIEELVTRRWQQYGLDAKK